MARMGNRVTQVANAEAENSEDPEFRNAVSTAAIGVSDSESNVKNLFFVSFAWSFFDGRKLRKKRQRLNRRKLLISSLVHV